MNLTSECPNCGASVDFNPATETTECSYCLTTLYILKTPEKKQESSTYTLSMHPVLRGLSKLAKVVIVILASVGTIFVILAVVFIVQTLTTAEPEYSDIFSDDPIHYYDWIYDPKSMDVHIVNPGEAFEFDGFQITVGGDYEWRVVESYDERSAINGLDALRVPLTVTNISDETQKLEFFRSRVYGSEGRVVHSQLLSGCFEDDGNIGSVVDIRSGATIAGKYIHFMYDGDGYYIVAFQTWNESWEVKLNIQK